MTDYFALRAAIERTRDWLARDLLLLGFDNATINALCYPNTQPPQATGYAAT